MSEWISVKERLPEKDGLYLCCIQNPFSSEKEWMMHMYGFSNNCEKVNEYELAGVKQGFYSYDSEWGYCVVDDVEYWQPLPNPPVNEENKKRSFYYE